MINTETMKEISNFIEWCNREGVKPSNGSVLMNYFKERNSRNKNQLSIAKMKGVMAEKGINQGDIAKFIGMSQMQISRKFSGKTDFSVTELLGIAELLGVEPQYFFTYQVDNVSTENRNTV